MIHIVKQLLCIAVIDQLVLFKKYAWSSGFILQLNPAYDHLFQTTTARNLNQALLIPIS